jgi:hypothetical protein
MFDYFQNFNFDLSPEEAFQKYNLNISDSLDYVGYIVLNNYEKFKVCDGCDNVLFDEIGRCRICGHYKFIKSPQIIEKKILEYIEEKHRIRNSKNINDFELYL